MSERELSIFEKRLYEEMGVKKETLLLEHPLFTMELKDNDNLVFEIDRAIGIELYQEDITHNVETSVSYIDLLFSNCNDDSFEWVSNMAKALRMMRDHEYSSKNMSHNAMVLCDIALQFFKFKYGNIESLADIDRPIPTQLFINIVNKQEDEFEVMYTDEDGTKFAGLLDDVQIGSSFFSLYISVAIRIISKGSSGYVENQVRFTSPFVPLAQSLSDIGVTVLTPEKKAEFKARGAKYVQCTKKPSYRMYDGFAYSPGGWFGDIRSRIKGRIMIDIVAMRLLNSRISNEWYVGFPFNGECFPYVNEDKLWMCSPVVFGFSFATKTWTKMFLEDVSEIKFSETAFEELIVPEHYKKIFVSCLQNEMPSLDSIDGKGNAKIFLLSGPPGTGKTMTAESVAELLHMPLYFVSVGELGTSPESMEKSLAALMEVASSWNAVVLLDEVDVFAVKREGSDVQRNAMTAIFLRLLERYNGIMFMTTNLIDNLDQAFISRATATIAYDALGSDDRKVIWRNLLERAEQLGMKIEEDVYRGIHELAEHDLNGREIKNNIRLAYSVAMSSAKKAITMSGLREVMMLKPQQKKPAKTEEKRSIFSMFKNQKKGA